ncbi:hypothetical protein [Quatrionicoccus australiensis]|uniref:hypothetical protein n=1 Tax=Quatrionicoccus australiensis TaxID=138118 RepID=UPI001CFBFE46|nr:hypothetical protein [Quatrionicoccus australiensis]MCB4359598.1 hypothetical protein [Quatrionicoccus australiensis]
MTQAQTVVCYEGLHFPSIDTLRGALLPDEPSDNPSKQYFDHITAITLHAMLAKLHSEGRLSPKAICAAVFDRGSAALAEWLTGTPAHDVLTGADGAGALTTLRQRMCPYCLYVLTKADGNGWPDAETEGPKITVTVTATF